MAIIRARELIEDINDPPVEVIKSCIAEHLEGISRLDRLENYYLGRHAILNRDLGDKGLPNNRIVSNHAKYITDIAVGYVTGNPVMYVGRKIDDLLDTFKKIDIISHDAELAKDLSIFGVGRELHFMSSDDKPIPKATVIDPRQLFLVVDDTVEYKSLFAVHCYPKKDLENSVIGYNINVYTANNIIYYFASDFGSEYEKLDTKQHYYKAVPVIEFWNNEEQQGDFEQQISLIDAYNLLQSDRVNDKEQLVDAFLKIKGVSFGDTEEEQAETARLLKLHKILELPQDADADWLVKNLDEQQVEILRTSLKDDIHEFSMVPNLTDENFASNASGVAMKYKLLGLEQLAKNKERYFVQGLRERLQLFKNALDVKGKSVEIEDIQIIMNRNLPANDLEIASMISMLGDGPFVSNETLIAQLSFVSDAAEETAKTEEQKREAINMSKAAFGMPFDGIEEVTEDEEQEE